MDIYMEQDSDGLARGVVTKVVLCCGGMVRLVNEGALHIDLLYGKVSAAAVDVHYCPCCGRTINLYEKGSAK